VKRIYLILILVISPSLLGSRPASAAQTTEILWDTWGVPHIFAKDTGDLFYAFGWAQMHSHGDLILRLYGQARGRAAEYWGEEYLESDKWVRAMGVADRAQEWYKAQPATFRKNLDAFAAGMNDYARKYPERISAEVRSVLPVNSVDVLAHSQRVIHFTFVSDPGIVATAARHWQSKGSNGWAIAPARSTSGNALLLANPHLPWSDLFLFYEAQLTAPGIDAYGATLVGFPVLGIAFNDRLGWTHTVNTHDGKDLFELTLADGGYRWDGKVRAFETVEQSLKVKQPDGSLRDQKLLVKHSVHGPVIAENKEKAIAVRVVGLDRPGMLEEWWDMARAKNLGEFESALKRLQLPMFNVIYADRDGHIMYLFNGLVPVRSKGDWDYWNGVVPGDTSATLWTEPHPYKDLPKVIDPPSHWLQNTNDPPWTTTFPLALDADKYPSYMAPRFMDFRSQASARMLAEDDRVSFDEMIEYKHSTRMELADRILDDLFAAVQEHGGELARKAAAVLKTWDHKAEANSRGAVLFMFWAREMKLTGSMASAAFSTRWSLKNALTTPDGLTDPKAAAAALESAAKKVEAAYGSLDVEWGTVARLRMGKLDLPANGGPGGLGIFRVLGLVQTKDGRFQAVGGDSYVAAVEFSNPVRAKAVMTYGNASQPDSPHISDQLNLVAKKQLRPVWRTYSDVKANLESRELLGERKER
jgi:acyl-homoserine-lactone acylase